MFDYDVILVNNKMFEFFVKFKGLIESEFCFFFSEVIMWCGNEFVYVCMEEVFCYFILYCCDMDMELIEIVFYSIVC